MKNHAALNQAAQQKRQTDVTFAVGNDAIGDATHHARGLLKEEKHQQRDEDARYGGDEVLPDVANALDGGIECMHKRLEKLHNVFAPLLRQETGVQVANFPVAKTKMQSSFM